MRNLFPQFGFLLFSGLLSGCSGGKALSSYQVATGGNPSRGEQLIVHYKCGSCHTIPTIQNANGVFGPPLNEMARRSIIAGEFPNEPESLVRWVQSPTSMKPATAMPDLGLSEQQARDVAAYLETLR
jgi:cytochrome c2